MTTQLLGIDVGGSGIKAAIVDLESGDLLTKREREDTPLPATPDAVANTLAEMVDGFGYTGPIGVGFPSVVRDGIAETANNIDESWIGRSVAEVFSEATGLPTTVINDADAAAVAEQRFGAARGVSGLVLTITFGTGIGSGLLVDGRLVPNLELGQLELDGKAPVESYFSAKARRQDDLDWDEWGSRANRFLIHVDRVFNPNLMVIGGGLTRHWAKYEHTFDPSLRLEPARLGNSAGLVGAALVSHSASADQG